MACRTICVMNVYVAEFIETSSRTAKFPPPTLYGTNRSKFPQDLFLIFFTFLKPFCFFS